MGSVYRVNWLRAKARLTRWDEELRLVPHEMDWTVNWLKRKVGEWKELARRAKESYMVAYAERQAGQWEDLAWQAENAFKWVRATKREDRKWKHPPYP